MIPPRDDFDAGEARTSPLIVHSTQRSLADGRRSPGGADPGPEAGDGAPALGRYVRVLRDRWKIVVTAFVVVTAAVGVGVAITEPVYRALAAIEIRKQATEVVPVDALFQFERISDQYLQTEYGTLRSRAVLERTLADAGLADRLQRSLLGAAAPGAVEAAAPSRLAEAVRDRLIVDPLVGSRIIRVGFDSPDPRLSADVVNAVVDHYATMRREAGAAAIVRLGEQADSVRVQLLTAERELQAYVHANGLGAVVVAGGEGETVPQERLRRLQQELTEAEAEGYRTAAISGAARESEDAALESDLLKSLRVRIAELAGEYARARPTFTDSFPRVRQLRSELAQLDSLVAVEQGRVSGAMSSQHDAAVRRRNLLRAAVDEQRAIVDALTEKLAEYERRHRDVESLKQLYATLQQKRKEAALSSALASMDIAVLDAAVPPLEPLRPRPKRDLALAGLTGLLLGLALAFLRDYTDTTVRSPGEIGGVGRVPLLASIPAVPTLSIRRNSVQALAQRSLEDGETWHRIDQAAPGDPQLAEAFRGLRTSVLFDAGGTLPRSLLVTSSAPGEGKTTVSTNFALSLTMLGHRVLLVDADLRRPSLHRVFGLPRWPGLVDHLEACIPWQQLVVHDVAAGLDLLRAGAAGANASDLLSGSAVHGWIAEAIAAYDFVILDAPALDLNEPDARILAHVAQGVLLVVRSGATSREAVRRHIAQTPNLVGVILNQLSLKRLPPYYTDLDTAGARPDAPFRHRSHEEGRHGPEDPEATAAVT